MAKKAAAAVATRTQEVFPTITCDATGVVIKTTLREDGSPKLPRGWKRLGGKVFSKEGLQKSYTLRCLKFPVVSVVEGYDRRGWTMERSKAGWSAFGPALRVSLEQARRIRNHVLFRLAGMDTQPLLSIDGRTVLPELKYDKKSLDRELRLLFPDIDSQSLYDVGAHAARAYFKRNRWDVRVTGKKQLETCRNAVLPLPEANSEVLFEPGDAGRPFVKTRIAGSRFLLRLGSGKGFRQYVGHLRGVAEARLVRGMASIRKRRNGDVMFHLPVWIPKRQPGADAVLLLSTHTEHLLVAEVQDEHSGPPFRFNEDQLRRWSAEVRWWQARHKLFRERIGDDRKREKRYDHEARRQMERKVRERCEKNRNRVQDRLRKVAASVAQYAARRNCFRVVYDDAVTTYLDIPWATLRRFLAEALEMFGIELVCRGGSEEPGDEEGE